MKVFFDNCTSPVLAGTLNALLKPDGDEARHIRTMSDYGIGAFSPDIEWIERLSADRTADWIVVTGDDNIRRNKAERLAWRRSGLRGFVMASGFQKMPVNQRASFLLWRWPDMKILMQQVAGGSMFELPVNRNSKFRPLPV